MTPQLDRGDLPVTAIDPSTADLIGDGLVDYLATEPTRPALGAAEHVAAYLAQRGWTLTRTNEQDT